MKVSLKAKLTASIAFLVLLVMVATAALYWSELISHALSDVWSRANAEDNQVFDQAHRVLARTPMPASVDPNNAAQLLDFAASALKDPTLVSSVQSVTAYSPGSEYVAITDGNNRVILHNNPSAVGSVFAPNPPFTELTGASLWGQLRAIYGPPRVYDVVLPLKFGPVALDLRTGVSTVFLGGLVKPELKKALQVSLLVVVLATLTAGALSFLLLRPLDSIAIHVDRMARGELPPPVEIARNDEWGILSSKLNLLGERIRGEKAAFVALKENLDQLLANLADGLMFFDQQDRLVLATPAMARFLNQPVEELLRRLPAEIFSGHDQLSQLLREAFAKRQGVSGQTVKGPGGSEMGRVAASVVFVEEQAAPVASLVTLRDAETRARLEDQIDVTAKLAAIGRVTSGVAHEVKNPLNAMVLQLEILRAKLGAEDEAMPHLEILGSEVRRLDRVVRTFLDFAKPVELHPAETDLDQLVEQVFRMAEPEARRNHVQLRLEKNGTSAPFGAAQGSLSDGRRLARVDSDLMKQALLNLILNGCQAMPSGGELRVASHLGPHSVELEISDQGIGIPPEAYPRIFSLYYTTKASGTGVGLAMAYRIVQLHNGSIEFSSHVNRGTTFRVTLPR